MKNPVLVDLRIYRNQRQLMNNPKGWDHILEAFESAAMANPWGASVEQLRQAHKVLMKLQRVERLSNEKNLPIEFTPRMKQIARLGKQLGYTSRSVAEDIKGQAKDGLFYPIEQVEAEVLKVWKTSTRTMR